MKFNLDFILPSHLIYLYLSPYLLLLIGIDNIFSKIVPYRGEYILLIRLEKLKRIKRRRYLKKIKFWKK